MWRILNVLEPSERAHVAMYLRPHAVLAPNKVIFYQGDLADSLFVVERGRIQLTAAQHQGKELTYRIVQSGEAFGGLALAPGAEGEPRDATATTLEHTALLTLSRSAFAQLRLSFPAADRLAVDALAEDVRQLRTTLEVLAGPVEQRILGRLLFLAHAYDDGTGQPIVIPTTQAGLAALAQASRPTTNQVLCKAKRDGLIDQGRSTIVILDRDRLAKKSNGIPSVMAPVGSYR
jgi:CRP/FNR family cyclic AMP-dependent transcriptional regulator